VSEFTEVKIDLERVLDHVTLDNVSPAARRRLSKLNVPGAKDLVSKDPAVAAAAARRFARHYLRLPAEPIEQAPSSSGKSSSKAR
jgi:hypothetical protein